MREPAALDTDNAGSQGLLLAVAARLGAEADTYRRLFGHHEGRSATVEAYTHCASIARQLAFEVAARGAEAVIKRWEGS